jgi:hypothetical protein
MYKCYHCERVFETLHARVGHQRVHSNRPRSGIEIQKAIERNKLKKINNEKSYYTTPLICTQCSTIVSYEKAKDRIRNRRFKEYNNIFCSKSCAAKYNNTHKKTGNRRSKLEIWLESKLIDLYPDLEIHFNRKDAINSELDIFFPTLKLAFELNGIYHYEPIHGIELLTRIKSNDNRKFQACIEQDIELCIIDASSLSYFKEQNAQPFLSIIQNIINQKTSSRGFEPRMSRPKREVLPLH